MPGATLALTDPSSRQQKMQTFDVRGGEGSRRNQPWGGGSRLAHSQAVRPKADHKTDQRARLIERELCALRNAEDYEELEFAAEALGLEDDKVQAAAKFDERHIYASGEAKRHLAKLRFVPTSDTAARGFRAGYVGVTMNRYCRPETYALDKFEPHKRKRLHQRKKRWRLQDSVWAPRRKFGNSKDWFETSAALRRMVMADWKMAQVHHNLAYFLTMVQLSPHERKGVAKDGAFDHPALDATRDVLLRNAKCIYDTFDRYAMMPGAYGRSTHGSVLDTADVSNIGLNNFFLFIRECHIEDDDECDMAQINAIYSIVDAVDGNTHGLDLHNQVRSINRHEFLQILIRLAVRKNCRFDHFGHERGDVAEAVEQLIHENLMRHLPPTALQDSNAFRKCYCYIEPTDNVLKKHLPMLRALYTIYAREGNDRLEDHSKLATRSWMSAGEWLHLIMHVGLIETHLVTVSTLYQVFIWSRIRSCVDLSDREEMRVRNLFFEDFLEALVRLASTMALPTDAEIEASGAQDAGEFMLTFHATAPEACLEFITQRQLDWFEHPHQGIDKCIEHLLAIIARAVEANGPPGWKLGSMTDGHWQKAVESFCKTVTSKGNVPRIPACAGVADIVSSLRAAEVQLLEALRRLPAFAALSEENLLALRAAMSVGKYEDGKYVIEQGEVGDVFYVITSGVAEVLHYDPEDPEQEEQSLAMLEAGACFGETALLEDSPRNATIVAVGQLYVSYISRADFEKVLGPLSDFHLRDKADNEAEAGVAALDILEAVDKVLEEDEVDDE